VVTRNLRRLLRVRLERVDRQQSSARCLRRQDDRLGRAGRQVDRTIGDQLLAAVRTCCRGKNFLARAESTLCHKLRAAIALRSGQRGDFDAEVRSCQKLRIGWQTHDARPSTIAGQSTVENEKIFGPGNKFVTAAKQLVTDCAIDLPARPYEAIVLGGGRQRALDCCRSTRSSRTRKRPASFLVTTSRSLAQEVQREIKWQLGELPFGMANFSTKFTGAISPRGLSRAGLRIRHIASRRNTSAFRKMSGAS